jgi:hypothetical protein
MLLVASPEAALSVPVLVYDFTAKYHVPVPRLSTT